MANFEDPQFYGGKKDNSNIQRQLLDLSSMCNDLKNESKALKGKLKNQEKQNRDLLNHVTLECAV
jgi:D-alanyl-D-alanine dipeptidase